MKKNFFLVLLTCSMVLAMTACGKGKDNSQEKTDTTQTGRTESNGTANKEVSELVDGKFTTTRKITVEVYDRGNDGGSDPENNMYTDYIKKGMLEEHNVEVTFKKVPRWTEVDDINNLLAAGEAPDVCVTYSYPTVLTYAQMGGIIDLSSYIEEYKNEIPNLWNWLGEKNIYWDKDPKDGTLWAIEGKRAEQQRIVTFVRQDWLDKLNMKDPTTTQEFEDMLYAFKENAELLLGADADKMIPFSVSYDVGWRAANLITSFLDPNITDREFYINGFDDRMATQKDTKEAVKLLNKWYNAGLMWNDFALYGSGDTTESDMIKAGYIGSLMQSWDEPFRNGEDGFNSNLRRNVSEDAKYVPIDPFPNSKGEYAKMLYSSAGDRKIFFPTSNDEPVASILYLDFISKPETIKYLQAGEEGITHEVMESGAIKIIAATGNAIQNSGKNIDYSITCNGVHFGDEELAALSLAYGYADADPELVMQASEIALTDGISPKNVNVGEISAEAGVGDTLTSKRDQLFDNAVVASENDFDSVWDSFMADYLSAGGQAIMDERAAKWHEYFGDAEMLP